MESKLRTNMAYLKVFGLIYRGTPASFLHCATVLLLTACGTLHYMMQIYWHAAEMDAVTIVEVIHWICVCISDWTCSLTLILKSDRLVQLEGLISAPPYWKVNGTSRQLASQANNEVIKLSNKITILVFIALAGALVKEPMFGMRNLPLCGWFPFEVTDWSTGYWAALSFQVVFAFNVCVCECVHMVVFVAFALHLAARIRILRMTLGHLAETTLITNCIEQHLAILRYFDIFQDIYSYILLTTALSTALKSCTIGYLVTDPKTTAGTNFTLIAILVPEMSTAVLYCWLGQAITDEGERLREVIYDTNWYQKIGGGRSTRVVITMMQLRCTIPLTLSGHHLQKFSREGLTEIMTLSYSYFNMLTALRAKK